MGLMTHVCERDYVDAINSSIYFVKTMTTLNNNKDNDSKENNSAKTKWKQNKAEQKQNKTLKYDNNKKISANDKRIKEYERKDFTMKTKRCPTIGMYFKKGFNKLNIHVPIVIGCFDDISCAPSLISKIESSCFTLYIFLMSWFY